MRVENIRIYGLCESVIASGYPMRTETTDMIHHALDDKEAERANRLSNAPIGSGHDNFLNGCVVQFDLTFSKQAWSELQRYHFIDFVSSQSTMHCIQDFKISDSCNKYVSDAILRELVCLRDTYKESGEEGDFLRLIYNIPSGFELTARLTTNYRQLKTVYSQRKNHRLPEWREFCEWIKGLPFSEYIVHD